MLSENGFNVRRVLMLTENGWWVGLGGSVVRAQKCGIKLYSILFVNTQHM
jgi:hypothetical protein